MCNQTFELVGLNDQRTAYEVESFLTGVPTVDSATVDIIDKTVTVEYDDTETSEESILDYIEYAGCTPSSRVTGVMGKLKHRIGI